VNKVKFNIYLNSKKTYTECEDIDVNSFICIYTNYKKMYCLKKTIKICRKSNA